MGDTALRFERPYAINGILAEWNLAIPMPLDHAPIKFDPSAQQAEVSIADTPVPPAHRAGSQSSRTRTGMLWC
jgi:hypothetical protein